MQKCPKTLWSLSGLSSSFFSIQTVAFEKRVFHRLLLTNKPPAFRSAFTSESMQKFLNQFQPEYVTDL